MQTILPLEAALLNSLRRLLTVVPQTNDLLTSWARTTADSPGRERLPTPGQSPSKGTNFQMAGQEEPTAAVHGLKDMQAAYCDIVTFAHVLESLQSSTDMNVANAVASVVQKC